jgi:hypothetical protein
LLGRREAFGIVAARCSAAEAAQIKELRDSKAYLEVAADWREFTPKYLQMSHDSADRIIRNLEEFGPTYFEVAQFTRISPATYRAIAPSIDDQGLHHNGEAIKLIPENAQKVASAVAEMRKTITVTAKAVESPDPYLALESACDTFLNSLEMAVESRKKQAQVRCLLWYTRDCLDEIEATM